jgi:hypothetical protein
MGASICERGLLSSGLARHRPVRGGRRETAVLGSPCDADARRGYSVWNSHVVDVENN